MAEDTILDLTRAFSKKERDDPRRIAVDGVAIHKFAGVVVCDERLVLVQREAYDRAHNGAGEIIGQKRVVWWELPGGKAEREDNKSPQRAVEREVLEECGVFVHVANNPVLLDSKHHRKGKMVAYYPCQYIAGNPYNTLEDEHLAVEGFKRDGLQRLYDSGANIRVPRVILQLFAREPDCFAKAVARSNVFSSRIVSPY